MGLMTMCNLAAIFPLSKHVWVLLDDYLKQRKAGKEPTFHRSQMPDIESDIDCWEWRGLRCHSLVPLVLAGCHFVYGCLRIVRCAWVLLVGFIESHDVILCIFSSSCLHFWCWRCGLFSLNLCRFSGCCLLVRYRRCSCLALFFIGAAIGACLVAGRCSTNK